ARDREVSALLAGLRTLGASGRTRFGLAELAPLLSAYEIPVATPVLAPNADAAAVVASSVGFPLALKIVSPDLTHKTDVGGVRLSLRSPEEVADAVHAMTASVRVVRPEARIDGFLLQRMAPQGHELLVGAVRDAQFGPMVVVGFGGVYVEVLRDTSARLAPLTIGDALAMLSELQMAPVLSGVRGQPPVDRDKLARLIVSLGDLATAGEELSEIELNPVIASPAGAIAVDARAALSIPHAQLHTTP